MKTPCLVLALAVVTTLSAPAENSPIHVTVEQSNKTDAKVDKGKPSPDKTQTRALKITLDNNSTQTFEGLAVKYWFVGHTEGTHGTKVLKDGERKSTLGPRAKEFVESEVASVHFTEAHYDAKSKKATPASGDKMTGYAVRVLKDEKVLAEYYSEPSIKDLIKDGAPAAAPAPGAAAKPGAKPAAK